MAGIALGPSFLGRISPAALDHVFSPSVMTTLSTLGLLLFMFVVSLEVDLKRVLNQSAAVVLTSNVSILLPLALGIGLARFFLSRICWTTRYIRELP